MQKSLVGSLVGFCLCWSWSFSSLLLPSSYFTRWSRHSYPLPFLFIQLHFNFVRSHACTTVVPTILSITEIQRRSDMVTCTVQLMNIPRTKNCQYENWKCCTLKITAGSGWVSWCLKHLTNRKKHCTLLWSPTTFMWLLRARWKTMIDLDQIASAWSKIPQTQVILAS